MMTGAGTGPGLGAFAVGGIVFTHGAYNFASSMQDMQNALYGTDYPGPFAQLGQTIGGDNGLTLGDSFDTGMDVLNMALGVNKAAVSGNTSDILGAAQGSASTVNDHILSDNTLSCPRIY